MGLLDRRNDLPSPAAVRESAISQSGTSLTPHVRTLDPTPDWSGARHFFHSISAMPAYCKFSTEELRLVDYGRAGSARTPYASALDFSATPPLQFASMCAMSAYSDRSIEEIRLEDYWYHRASYDFVPDDLPAIRAMSDLAPVLSLDSFEPAHNLPLRRAATANIVLSRKSQDLSPGAPLPAPPLPAPPVEPSSPPETEREVTRPRRAATFASSRDRSKTEDAGLDDHRKTLLTQLQAMYRQAEEIDVGSDKTEAVEKLKSLKETAEMFNRVLGLVPEDSALSALQKSYADDDDDDEDGPTLADQKVFPSVLALPDSPSSELHDMTEDLATIGKGRIVNQEEETDDALSNLEDASVEVERSEREVSGKIASATAISEPKSANGDAPDDTISLTRDANPFTLPAPKTNPFDSQPITDRQRANKKDFSFSIGRSKSIKGLARSKSRSGIGRSGSATGIVRANSRIGLASSGSRGGLTRSSSTQREPVSAVTAPAKKPKRRHSQLNDLAFGSNPTPFAAAPAVKQGNVGKTQPPLPSLDANLEEDRSVSVQTVDMVTSPVSVPTKHSRSPVLSADSIDAQIESSMDNAKNIDKIGTTYSLKEQTRMDSVSKVDTIKADPFVAEVKPEPANESDNSIGRSKLLFASALQKFESVNRDPFITRPSVDETEGKTWREKTNVESEERVPRHVEKVPVIPKFPLSRQVEKASSNYERAPKASKYPPPHQAEKVTFISKEKEPLVADGPRTQQAEESRKRPAIVHGPSENALNCAAKERTVVETSDPDSIPTFKQALMRLEESEIDRPEKREEPEQLSTFKQRLLNLERNLSTQPTEPKMNIETPSTAHPVDSLMDLTVSSPEAPKGPIDKRELPAPFAGGSLPPKDNLELPLMAPSASVTSHISGSLLVTSSSSSSTNSVHSSCFVLTSRKNEQTDVGSTASLSSNAEKEEDSTSVHFDNVEEDVMSSAPRSILSGKKTPEISVEEPGTYEKTGRRVSFRVVDGSAMPDKNVAQTDKSENFEAGGLDPMRKPAPLPPYAVVNNNNANSEAGYDSDSSDSAEFVDAPEEVSSKASDRFWTKMTTSAKQRAEDAELEKLSRDLTVSEKEEIHGDKENENEEKNVELQDNETHEKPPLVNVSDNIAKRMQVFLASERAATMIDDGVNSSTMTDSIGDEILRKSMSGHGGGLGMLGGRFFSKKKKSSEDSTDMKNSKTDGNSTSSRSPKTKSSLRKPSNVATLDKPKKQIRKSSNSSEKRTKKKTEGPQASNQLKAGIRKSLSFHSDNTDSSPKSKVSRTFTKGKSTSFSIDSTSFEVRRNKKKEQREALLDRKGKELGRKRDNKKSIPESMRKRMEAVTSLPENPVEQGSDGGAAKVTKKKSAPKSASSRDRAARKESGASSAAVRVKKSSNRGTRHVAVLQPRATSDIVEPRSRPAVIEDNLSPRANSNILGLSKHISRSTANNDDTSNSHDIDVVDCTLQETVGAASMANLPSASNSRQLSLSRRHSMPPSRYSNEQLGRRGSDVLAGRVKQDRGNEDPNEVGLGKQKRTHTMLAALWASGARSSREESMVMPRVRRASTDLDSQRVGRQGSMHNPSVTNSDYVDDENRPGGLLKGVRRLFSRKLRRKERDRAGLTNDRQSIAGLPAENAPRGSISRGSTGMRGSVTRGSTGMRGSMHRGSTGTRSSMHRGSTGNRVSLVGRATGSARRAKSEHKNARRRAPLFG